MIAILFMQIQTEQLNSFRLFDLFVFVVVIVGVDDLRQMVYFNYFNLFVVAFREHFFGLFRIWHFGRDLSYINVRFIGQLSLLQMSGHFKSVLSSPGDMEIVIFCIFSTNSVDVKCDCFTLFLGFSTRTSLFRFDRNFEKKKKLSSSFSSIKTHISRFLEQIVVIEK